MILCFVQHCPFAAESSIEDFQVCSLHDHPDVRKILESLKLPVAGWALSLAPLVMAMGELTEEHFHPREAPPWTVTAGMARRNERRKTA